VTEKQKSADEPRFLSKLTTQGEPVYRCPRKKYVVGGLITRALSLAGMFRFTPES